MSLPPVWSKPASAFPEHHCPESVGWSLPQDAFPARPCQPSLELSWLWGEGAAHVLPQMRLWKGREAALEQAQGDERGFSGVVTAERATQASMPRVTAGPSETQVWFGACLPLSQQQG